MAQRGRQSVGKSRPNRSADLSAGTTDLQQYHSQEFLLTSKPGTRLQWTAGVFYFNNKDEWLTYIDNFANTPLGRIRLGGSGTTTENIAGYFDATYELMPDKFYLTVGARYSHDEVNNAYWDQPGKPTQQNYVPNINSNKVTPRVVLRYKPTDQSSVYASYTEGYKAAIIDVGGSCQDGPAFQCNPIHPEDVYAFEVGYKFDSRTFSNQSRPFTTTTRTCRFQSSSELPRHLSSTPRVPRFTASKMSSTGRSPIMWT